MKAPITADSPAPALPDLCSSLLEYSPMPMAALEGARHIIRAVNPTFCRLVGEPREALLGRPFADTVRAGDGCLALVERVYRTGTAETHTVAAQAEPQSPYGSSAVWPVLDAEHRPVGVVVQVTETTELHQQTVAMNEALVRAAVHQHELTAAAETLNALLRAEIAARTQAEAALRDSEARLQLALDAASMGTFLWHVQDDRGEPDARMCALFGQPPEGTLTLKAALDTLLHPDDRDRYAEAVACAADPAGSGVLREDIRIRLPNGGLRWLAIAAQVHFAGNPRRAAHMAGTAMDITVRKQAEADRERLLGEVQQEREKLAVILQHITDEVWLCDTAGTITLLNATLTGGMGPTWSAYTRSRPGDRWEELEIYTSDGIRRPRGETPLLRAWQRGEVVRDVEEIIRHPSTGELIYRLVQAAPLRDEAGRFLGAVAAVRDVTAQRAAADAQARLLAEVQRSNEELQQFAYIVSHDLMEPLRTMSVYIELLAQRAQGTLESAAAEWMAFVTDAAQRMRQMLTDLLAYTRAGQTPEFQPVECEAVLAQVLDALQVSITESDATITHDPLPTLRGDATRLGHVLQNLIGNALKFRGKTPPRIHLAAVKEGPRWQFAVRDNGIGIDPQQVGKLFQVFQRAHGREYAGTGIGLAICKRIVEQHGGRIWVESKPGEGSIFYFTLPERREGAAVK